METDFLNNNVKATKYLVKLYRPNKTSEILVLQYDMYVPIADIFLEDSKITMQFNFGGITADLSTCIYQCPVGLEQVEKYLQIKLSGESSYEALGKEINTFLDTLSTSLTNNGWKSEGSQPSDYLDNLEIVLQSRTGNTYPATKILKN